MNKMNLICDLLADDIASFTTVGSIAYYNATDVSVCSYPFLSYHFSFGNDCQIYLQ